MNKYHNKRTVVRDLSFSLLTEGKILKIKANGYSMYPLIKPGSVIFIEPLSDEPTLTPGEIIAWKRESGFVVHRLIRITLNGNEITYFTRGDSCARIDNPVTRDQIAGKVVRVETLNNKIIEGPQLIRNPCYIINRMNVWFIIKIKRIFSLLTDPPTTLKGG